MNDKRSRAQGAKVAAGGGKTTVATPDKLTEEIRARAYELHCARGNGNGSDMDDWLAAEREIKAKHNIAG